MKKSDGLPSLFYVDFPVLCRRYAETLLELLGEVGDTVVAEAFGDVGDAHIFLFDQQPRRVVEFLSYYIGRKIDVVCLLEGFAQVALAYGNSSATDLSVSAEVIFSSMYRTILSIKPAFIASDCRVSVSP